MAKYLLDTHVLVWWLMDAPELSQEAKEILLQSESLLYVSAASLWEMRIKELKGMWDLPSDILDQLERWQVEVLTVDAAAAYGAPALKLTHSDPFDRMIFYQALHNKLVLLTADTILLSQEAHGPQMIKAK